MNQTKEKVLRNAGLVNSWRSKVFTQKGKAIGFPEEWKTFDGFVADVGEDYKEGYILRRKDTSKPYSKENCVWDVKGSESDSKSITLAYNNETKKIYEWCELYHLNYNGVMKRYYHGKNYTAEEILFGKRVHRFSKTCKESTNVRAKASKMISSYKVKDYKNNLEVCDFSIDWFIENIISKPCVYCGDTHRVGADRIDNHKGHTKENCVPCCYECNVARGNNFSYREMLLIGKTIREIKSKRNENNIAQ